MSENSTCNQKLFQVIKKNIVNKIKNWLPLIFAALVALGIYIGMRMNEPYRAVHSLFSFRTGQFNKINDVINYINMEYVDTVNQKKLVENTIENMLHQLDPHSAYIPADALQASNEPLEGNFDGIGIEFHIQNDTIMVVAAVSGGPSDALGIMAGDRIIKVDVKKVANIHITSKQVIKRLFICFCCFTYVKVVVFLNINTKFIGVP